MEIMIHRGAHVIGGTCIEINCTGSRILLDMGTPLMDKAGGEIDDRKLAAPSIENGILPDVKGLYKNQEPGIDAVLISHAHLDHYGLLDHIHPSIPVFLSRGSKALIDISRIFYPPNSKVFYENFKTFRHWQPFSLGPFTITPYLVDHSAYDASAFLIAAAGRKIFYSGDFRGHGRKAVLYENMIKNPIREVDCLLMEGTTLNGGHCDGLKNEIEVEDALSAIFTAQKDLSFIAASGSNIDRLVSIYRAARRSEKTLVMDLYTAYVLEKLKEITPKLPPFEGDNVRIFYLKKHAQDIVDNIGRDILHKYRNRKIEMGEIAENRHQMVLKLPVSAMKRVANHLIRNKPVNQSTFIFSMWPGYLEKESCFYDFCTEYGAQLTKVHVSGHAYLDALKGLAGALRPGMLIPVHTLSGDDFKNHFENVVRIDDATTFTL